MSLISTLQARAGGLRVAGRAGAPDSLNLLNTLGILCRHLAVNCFSPRVAGAEPGDCEGLGAPVGQTRFFSSSF